MKSIKDAITLYRTLIAEGLSEFSYTERGESLGRHLDDLAWRLSMKVRPSREDTLPTGLWQNVGWMDETGIDLGALIEEVDRHSADSARHYLDNMEASVSVGPTSADVITALFKPKEDRAKQIFEETSAAWRPLLDKLGEGKVEWGIPEVRTAESVAAAQESIRKVAPTFGDFNIHGIEPWQERVQDSVNDMITRIAQAQDDMMRGTITQTFIMGVDPESEWTKVSRERVEKMATIPVGEDKVADWIVGIPLYVDPDDDTMLRMKTADIMAAPNGPKIIETVFGVSDPDGSVEDNPTT